MLGVPRPINVFIVVNQVCVEYDRYVRHGRYAKYTSCDIYAKLVDSVLNTVNMLCIPCVTMLAL